MTGDVKRHSVEGGRTAGRWPRSPGVTVTVAGALAVVVAAFLPWSASGETTRSSFELLQAADRLDLLSGGPRRVGLTAWYLLPVLVAVVWLTATLDRPVATAVAGTAVAAVALAGAGVVLNSPLKAEAGVPMAVVAAAAALAGAALIVWERKGTT